MYMKDPGESTADLPPLAPGTRTVLWTCALATLVLGVFPSAVLQFAGFGK
jgi:NADH:ubiquinone oxidoreductase subunit 2 (subunit N)